ncbi:GDSL-type esterase/lipase family protein [bacterium]|nr:GDSL-type esterase/lipase family protein [bacterium]
MKIICLGDSITLGIRPGVANEQTFEFLLTSMLVDDGIDVEIINAGIGGENTAGGLERFAKDVIGAHPDYVTIMYGTNDAAVNEGCTEPRVCLSDYESNLRSMISQAGSAGIASIIMTPIPLGDHWSYVGHRPYKEQGANCVIKAYVDAVRKIAADESIPLIDNHAAWWEWQSKTGSRIETLQTDSCHPNPAGHKLLAETMYKVIHMIAKR